MSNIDRVSSGITELDDRMQGGFPEGGVVAIAGASGAGKTIFSSQFIWDGLQNYEQCLYISLEEPVESIKQDARLFGWEFDDYDDGLLEIEYLPPEQETQFLNQVAKLIEETDADRIVIDCVTVLLGQQGGDTARKRKSMYRLYRRLKEADTTTLVTAEQGEHENEFITRYGVVEYVADGVVMLYYNPVGEEVFRNLAVRKMRNTAHSPGTHPFKITDDGIELSSSGL